MVEVTTWWSSAGLFVVTTSGDRFPGVPMGISRLVPVDFAVTKSQHCLLGCYGGRNSNNRVTDRVDMYQEVENE